jgi:hypothetical protein
MEFKIYKKLINVPRNWLTFDENDESLHYGPFFSTGSNQILLIFHFSHKISNDGTNYFLKINNY